MNASLPYEHPEITTNKVTNSFTLLSAENTSITSEPGFPVTASTDSITTQTIDNPLRRISAIPLAGRTYITNEATMVIKSSSDLEDVRSGKLPPSGISIAANLKSNYLSIQVGQDGRFNSGIPVGITGNGFDISNNWPAVPWSSFTTIRIDGVSYIFGSTDGTFIKQTTNLPDHRNETIWKVGKVEIKQSLQINYNPFTHRQDNGMYKYTITNTDNVKHEVGIRILIDTMLDNNDGVPIILPNGEIVTYERDFASISYLPKYWKILNSLNNPDIIIKGTLKSPGITKPDRFAICYWPNIYNTLWDYTVNSNQSITDDSSVVMWWLPKKLESGRSKEFITFYGPMKIAQYRNSSIVSSTTSTKLSTGPVVRDYQAHSLVIVIQNTTNSDVSIAMCIKDLSNHEKKSNLTNLTVTANCTKTIIMEKPYLEYEIIFDKIPKGVYLWTSTRIEDELSPLNLSHFINTNTFNHSQLINLAE